MQGQVGGVNEQGGPGGIYAVWEVRSSQQSSAASHWTYQHGIVSNENLLTFHDKLEFYYMNSFDL